MRWFHRIAVGLAVALCAWLALPPGAGAAPKPPIVSSVIEGRDASGKPVVILVGHKLNKLKELSVEASDGIRQDYRKQGQLIVKSSKPRAQIPMEMANSGKVGVYSNISPRGVGMNPGTTRPIPFSIQMPTKASTQAIFRVSIFLRNG